MYGSSEARTISRRGFLGTLGALGGLTLLAACGQSSSPSAPSAGQPGASGAPAAVSTKDVTISYWNGLTGADGPIMDELIERFTRETGIKVEQQRIPWADLYPKLQISAPAGEGPDLCLMHTSEIPHFAADGILDELDDKTLGDRGFKGEDYVQAPWEGGIFKGKRYAVPLDIPQFVMYLNNPLLKDAGLMGADGAPKVPTNRDELLSTARAVTRGDVFGLVFGGTSGVGTAWAFHNLLWQNETNVFQSDLKKSALSEPPAIQAAEFWGTIHAIDKVAPPPGTVALDAFVAGKLGIFIGGTWNIVGLKAQKADFTVGPMPTIFKKPAVFTIPHQFTFPKPKTRNDAKREAAFQHIRWISDNVVDWTLRAGQVSPIKKVQQDQRITSDPSLKVFLGQAPNWTVAQPSVNWTRAEQLTPPQLEAVYLGQKPAADAMRELARQIEAL
ncbi:MAG: extracellular solute-binding protein [Chloroflexota bacterium]|nr:extracellular solute-binding protein [Chloroflexota bacterium]